MQNILKYVYDKFGKKRGGVKPAHSKGFALAEVLVTLGIIGVVSAMTLPTVTHKVQTKILETQFKETFSIINQAYMAMRADNLGVNLYKTYTVYDKKRGYYKANKFYQEFRKYLKKSHNLTKKITPEYKTYDSANVARATSGTTETGTKYVTFTPDTVLSNGAYLKVVIAAGGSKRYIAWIVDINGDKGPNRAGFDLFTFQVFTDDNIVEGTRYTVIKEGCSADQTEYFKGCSYFALKNECPTNKSKTYWECLPR